MEYIIIGILSLAVILLSVTLAAALIHGGKGRSKRESEAIRELFSAQERSKQLSDKLLREEILNTLEINRRSSAETVEQGLSGVRNVLTDKLDLIRGTVDEKMTKTLNERLDSNFKQIGERLGELYKSLGELSRLSGGVQDLNRTLSNVKARGVWGEQQLAAILEETMTRAQYDCNAITKRGSQDRVEFAIKLPAKIKARAKALHICR